MLFVRNLCSLTNLSVSSILLLLFQNSVNTLRDDILDGLMKKIEDSADSNTKDTSSDSE